MGSSCFHLQLLEVALSMIVSKQETKGIYPIAGNRELCLYLLLARTILRDFCQTGL